ncbi:MAG: D-glycerate dehydrogenase [Pseudomonadota bacterium]
MLDKKPRVVVTRRLPEQVEMRMRELFDAQFNPDDTPMSRDQLVDAMRGADVLVPTVTDWIGGDLIEEAGDQLKLIANFGNGIDNIDVVAAHERGISVTNTPDVLSDDTADMTLALILATPRRLVEGATHLLGKDNWDGWSPTWMLGRRLKDKSLGIIGMGRIGIAVARRAKSFGLKINYHNRTPIAEEVAAELEATYWPCLDQMMARMDIVSVNCPYTPATYHLLSARRLDLMQPHAYLVNTARGEIVDEAALIQLLQDGRIAGAGLDVFEHEPSVDERLCKLAEQGKVVLLPHMSSATLEGRIEMGERVIINIRMAATGDRPPNRILPAMV